ncbi:resolvase domain-containing protein [Mycobacterium xenopi RIVM700367]|uniref:recombinase family protein n=1 Tax=Mycobacterium xenopi TaxID=1789 RepID=UPI00025AE944|nr:recombinase family protein [Mycobacterium xenopi]EID10873.1 resolvase domain-containing protein [Mycobacterium xenopi RIVM700367]
MTKHVAYARVSTSKQTTDQQVAALQAAGCAPIFTEKMSGKRDDRPQLTAALAELEPGDTLTVWKLDRLGRDALQMLTTIKSLHDRGIVVRSLTDGLDSSTDCGRMVMTILAAVAEYEVGLKHERAEAKRKLIRQRGGSLGGAKPKLDAEQVAAVRRAHASGDTVASLARVHKVSRMTVYRMLEGQR